MGNLLYSPSGRREMRSNKAPQRASEPVPLFSARSNSNGRKVTSTSSLAFGSCARSLARLRDEMQSKKLVLPTGANLYLLSCLGSIGLGNSRLLLSLSDFGKYTVLNCPMYFVIMCQNILEHVWFHPCNSYKWNNNKHVQTCLV